VNSYCLVDQCVAPSTVSQNLSVVVTPTDPALAVQQFLPQQIQTVDGISTILLDAPQVLSGRVALPANCGDAGYPVHFEFTGPTVIPGVGNSFQFDTDEDGNLSAVLPIGSYTERVSTAVACAAPLFTSDVVISGGPYSHVASGSPYLDVPFDAPFVAGQQAPDAGLSLDIAGQVAFFDAGPTVDGGLPADAGAVDAGLPVGATVRILALADAGALAGARLSGDQPLQLIDGGLWFGSTFVPGGPAALPVPPSVGVIATQSQSCLFSGGLNPPATTCDQFIVEIGPSRTLSVLTTIDMNVNAPEIDGGENSAVTLSQDKGVLSARVTLPFNPMLRFNLPIQAVDPDGSPIPSAAVTITSVDGGIAACPPPDSGIACHLTATGITDPALGTLAFPVVPGRYALSLAPPAPLGSSVTVVDVLDAGELSVVAGPGSVVRDGVEIMAIKAVELKGTVREPSGTPSVNGPFLPSGQVELLTVADLVSVALGPVTDGMFDLLVPPGQYVVLIEPDSSTRFPVFYSQITIKENLPSQSYALAEPGQLAGIVEVEVDGGLPITTQAYLEFYYVTTDPDGGVVSYPVATAISDSEGRWSAAGPPGQ